MTDRGAQRRRGVVVVGGASGIGAACAARFAADGAAVAIVDRSAQGASATAQAVGGHAYTADVRDRDAIGAAIDAAVAALGGLDVVVNAAGVGGLRPLHTYDDDAWARLIGVNLTGAFVVLRAVIPHLLAGGGGAVVHVASVSGLRPTRGEAPYSAAKAGVLALTRSAALEYAPTVRVNCVSPGFIATPLTAAVLDDPELRAGIAHATPLGRIGSAEEVAAAVAFLASADAAYVTGQNLVVDGGSVLTNAQVDPVLRRLMGDAEGDSPAARD